MVERCRENVMERQKYHHRKAVIGYTIGSNGVYMLNDVPQFLSISLASKLVGLSAAAFKQHFLTTELVKIKPDTWGSKRRYVWRCDLEQAIGRRFTLAEAQRADRQLQPRRAYQQTYRRRQNRKVPTDEVV
jgi:hypothetical protein